MNPKDVMHDGFKREKAEGHRWFNCEHEWKEHPDSETAEVSCVKCGCPGEINVKDCYEVGDIERDGVFWPAT